MDLYEPGHLYVNFFKDQMPGLKYLGTQKDKYGYDGWQDGTPRALRNLEEQCVRSGGA